MPIALATPAVTDVPPHCGGVEKINICGEAYGAWGGVGSHLRGLPRPRPRRRQPPRCCRAGAAARAAARPGWPHLFWRTGAPAAAAARDGVSHRIAGGRNRGACRPDSADVRHRSCPSTQAFEMLKCRDPAHTNSQLAPRIAPTQTHCIRHSVNSLSGMHARGGRVQQASLLQLLGGAVTELTHS